MIRRNIGAFHNGSRNESRRKGVGFSLGMDGGRFEK